MRVFEKISEVLYPVILAGTVLGIIWSIIYWLRQHSAPPTAVTPSHIAAGVFTIVASSFLIERLIPLRALSKENWIYKSRPQHRLPRYDFHSLIQLVLAGLMGLLFGIVLNYPLLFSLGTVFVRSLPLIFVRNRIPVLLKAGQTRLVGTAAWSVLDSEIISSSLALNWLPTITQPKDLQSNVIVVFFRRLRRRSYLLFTAVILISSAITLHGLVDLVALPFFSCLVYFGLSISALCRFFDAFTLWKT